MAGWPAAAWPGERPVVQVSERAPSILWPLRSQSNQRNLIAEDLRAACKSHAAAYLTLHPPVSFRINSVNNGLSLSVSLLACNCLSISAPACLPAFLPVCLTVPVSLPAYLPTAASLSLCKPACPSFSLSACLSLCLSLCMLACLSPRLPSLRVYPSACMLVFVCLCLSFCTPALKRALHFPALPSLSPWSPCLFARLSLCISSSIYQHDTPGRYVCVSVCFDMLHGHVLE